MSETDNKPTLGRKPLGIKRSVEAGEVKQTFSHGRTNKVVVEVKRRKLIGKPGEAPAAPAPEVVAAPPPAPTPAPAPAPAPVAEAPKPRPPVSNETRQEMQSRLLREAEESRMNALEAVNRREHEDRLRAFETEKTRAEDTPTGVTAPVAEPTPQPEPEVAAAAAAPEAP